ncbi:MAG: ribosome maturation factor RimM [Desulfobacterales bacterium]|nr:ribosome maturation factor RimM [Desulfobacterales bacterium]
MTRGRGTGPPDHLRVGKVLKAQGIKGELKVSSLIHGPDNFKSYSRIILRHPQTGEHREFTLLGSRSRNRNAILALAGVTSRNESEALAGLEVWVNRAELPPLEPGKFYQHEVQGFLAITEDGRELGTVTGLINTKAHDILVIRGRDREYLVPLREEMVRFSRDRQQTLVITPLPGLLDMND